MAVRVRARMVQSSAPLSRTHGTPALFFYVFLNPGLAARIPNDGFDRVAVGGFHGTFKVDDDPAARRGFGDRDDRVVAFECSGLSLSHDVPHE